MISVNLIKTDAGYKPNLICQLLFSSRLVEQAKSKQHRSCCENYKIFVLTLALLTSAAANAIVPTTSFQLVGHIQNFCLRNQLNSTGDCPKDAENRPDIPSFNAADLPNTLFTDAKMVINGVTVTIPKNTVVVMPATYLTPWQIFAKAQGVSRGNHESGLSLQDKVPPLAAFEASIDGNIVCATPTTCDYIAGSVHISQQSLNMGAGFIRHIDNNTREICVGNDNTKVQTCTPPNARVMLNDPKINDATDPAVNDGRYGKPNPPAGPITSTDPNSRFPDPRFTVDQGNPTVHALTGYPMCVPRNANDPKCPVGNRPAGLTTFVMGPSPLPAPLPPGVGTIPNCPKTAGRCNQSEQAPLIEGDYINYAGTLAKDATGLYVSAHTIAANVGIYTEPGVDPTYVTIEDTLIGTMGPVAANPPTAAPACTVTMECQDRLKVEGFTTDPTISSPTSKPPNATARQVNIYAIDSDPAGVKTTLRRIANAAAFKPVPLGRFRYIAGKLAAVNFDNTGTDRGVTRELMVRVDNPAAVPPRNAPCDPSVPAQMCSEAPKVANGLIPGQYTAPVGEYIFPESIGLGLLPPKFNFQCLAFLTAGWSLSVEDPANPSAQMTILPKQLTPWPDTSIPAANFSSGGVNCLN